MKDKFIFDLDYTLYTIHDHIDTEDEHQYYSSFKKKPFMNHLLNKLKNKYIITNGTRSHALEIVKNMHRPIFKLDINKVNIFLLQ